MAIFTLTDIKFKGTPGNKGASQILESRYLTNTVRYPIDIGNTNQGHYMVIHINQQTRTQFGLRTTDDLPTIFDNPENKALQEVTKSVGEAGLFAIDQLQQQISAYTGVDGPAILSQEVVQKALSEAAKKFGVPVDKVETAVGGIKNVIKNVASSNISMLKQMSTGKGIRTIERTTRTIALYMPDTLNFSHEQGYSKLNLGGGTFGLLGAGADAGRSILNASDNERNAVIGEMSKNLTPFIASQLSKGFGDAGTALFASATGTAVNPQLELIYSSPDFRRFQFDFMFYPRSEKEAIEVQTILEELKFHQAPEVLNQGAGGLGGFFLVPPSEFDIKFYYNGTINPNIPNISTCVLTQIDTDYAPNGFAAYEKPGKLRPSLGGTGMPVAIRLTLQFMETQIITKRFLNRTLQNPFASQRALDLPNQVASSQAGEYGTS